MYRTSPEDDRVRAARAAIAERTHLWSVRGQLQRDLMEEEIRVDLLTATATSEQDDVDKLQRGLRSMLFGLSAARTAQLATEQQEAITATAALHEAEASRDELRAQLAALDARIAGLAGAPAELEQALAAKARQLAGTPAGEDLERIADQITNSDIDMRAIDEAITAGDRAIEKLVEVVAVAMSADRFGEGTQQSLLARAAEAARIHQANYLLGKTRVDLRLFERELADLGMQLYLSPDGTEVDIDVRTAAQPFVAGGTAERVQRVMGRVGELLGELRRRRAAIVAGVETLAAERAHLLGDPDQSTRS